MHKAINIFAVEDDFVQQAHLQLTLDEMGYDLVGMESRAEDALPKLIKSNADIALLDIQLAGKDDGISLGQQISDIPIIYLTAFQDQETYLRARLTQPHAYLLKPVNPLSLQASIESAIQYAAGLQPATPSWSADLYFKQCFFLKVGNKLVKVSPDEVMWVTVSGNHYCEVVTATRKANVRASLLEMEQKLQGFPFIRVHRSYLVNAQFIESIHEPNSTVMVQGTEIPLGKSFRDQVMQRIQKL